MTLEALKNFLLIEATLIIIIMIPLFFISFFYALYKLWKEK